MTNMTKRAWESLGKPPGKALGRKVLPLSEGCSTRGVQG